MARFAGDWLGDVRMTRRMEIGMMITFCKVVDSTSRL
jgi:hypothetical protein